MANKNKTEDQFEQVEQAVSKSERYIIDNQKSLMTILTAIVGIVALFVGYQNFYIAPMEKDAQRDIYMAELYFEKDSFNLALNGDPQYPGFLEIAEEYSSTKTGELANYYAGLCYLHTADYENAIIYLEKFSSDDVILSSLAKGCIGDAYLEIGQTDDAIDSYNKAIKNTSNNFTTTRYMMKLAQLYEKNGNFNDALDLYKSIKVDFKESEEAKGIEKYISRAEKR